MKDDSSEVPHYIWTKSERGNEKHYDACSALSLPSVFVSKQGKKFAYIAYDSLSMYGGDLKKSEKQKKTVTKVMRFYKEYAKNFGLPDDAFQAGGGENSFGFVVMREHTEFIAEGLYHYLITRK